MSKLFLSKFLIILCSALLLLNGCADSPKYKGIYENDKSKLEPAQLMVPPDLSEPVANDNMAIPAVDSGLTFSAFAGDTKDTSDLDIKNRLHNVSMERDGALRWLKIRMPVADIWKDVQDFFTALGFEIKRADKKLGVIETNWVENRASIPTNWFARMISKLYSSGLMDKYRVRIEPAGNDEVLVFIAHQGLKEEGGTVNGSSQYVETWWESRESDPELEYEMLQRLLLYVGTDEKSVEKLAGTAKATHRSRIIEKDNGKLLEVDENFARTWRRVGLALDRMGLLVEDRNRSAGLYYVKLTSEFRDQVLDKGWFANLFSGKNNVLEQQYLINVSEQDQKSLVRVYQQTGEMDAQLQEKILEQLKTYLD